jgi:hypothetical protein
MIKRIRAAFAALFVAGTIFAGTPASAVPAICVMPTTGTVSGLTLVQDINNCFGAALGLFAAGAAPGSPTSGMLWWNTSTGQVAQYDGSNWNNLWNVDSTNHLNAVQIGGGVQATLASASTTDLWSVAASSIAVTGTATITQFANADAVPGSIKIVTFAGALTLSQGGGSGGAPLNLPNNGGNIATAAGDYAIVLALTATNVQIIQYTRASGAALSTVGLNIGAAAMSAAALGSLQQPVNMSIGTSVSSFNLTISLLGQNGSAISSSNPVLINFRSQTLTTNGYNVFANITSAPASFTISLGSTMGCTSGVLCRLWIETICQTESPSGTGCSQVVIGASVQSNATTCAPLQEDALQSTGAGINGGAAVGTIYSTVGGLSGKAVRIIGYIEDTWTTGTGWGSPTKIQLFGPGVKKPCDVVQEAFTNNLTQTIVPTSPVNFVKMSAVVNCAVASGAAAVWTYKRGSTALVSHSLSGLGSAGISLTDTAVILDSPQTASAVTYSMALSGNSCGGAVADLDLQEIMGALDLEKILPENGDATADLPPRAFAGISASTRVTARPQPDRAQRKVAA